MIKSSVSVVLLLMVTIGLVAAAIPPARAADLATINFFTATPNAITAGQPATLSWSSFNGTSAIITPTLGQVNASGSAVVNPPQTTTYTFTLNNSAGTVTRSATVNVGSVPDQGLLSFDGGATPIQAQQATVQYPFATPNGPAIKADFVPPVSGGPALTQNFAAAQNWSNFNGIQVRLNTQTTEPVSLAVIAYDQNFRELGGQVFLAQSAATQTATYLFDPNALAYMIAPPPGVVADSLQPSFDITRVKQVTFWLKNFSNPTTLYITDARLFTNAGVVDSMGQFGLGEWPGKVHNVSENVAAHQQEQAALQGPPPTWDAHGGWANGPQMTATGHFRTAQTLGRWWLVTPEGHLFFSTAMGTTEYGYYWTIVGPNAGRKTLFDSLPNSGAPPSSAYLLNPDRYNYYYANLYHLYGDNQNFDSGLWQPRAMSRLQSWGFNTLGFHSRTGLVDQHTLPYTHFLFSNDGQTGMFPSGVPGYNVPDVFDPAYINKATQMISSSAAYCAANAYCIGSYIDNEWIWDPSWLPMSVPKEVLKTSNTPIKIALAARLQGKYGANNTQALNAAWGTGFASWTDFKQQSINLASLNGAQSQDLKDFLGYYMDAYYGLMENLYRQVAPNSLYLGSRFIPDATPAWSLPIVACHVDVMSFNLYEQQLNASDWWSSAPQCPANGQSKPVIASEFGFMGNDRGLVWQPNAKMGVGSQQARAQAYTAYMQSVLKLPAFVGVEWISYTDEPLTGVQTSPENGNFGFVSITDTPYPELVQAASSVNRSIYTTLAAYSPIAGDLNLDHIVNSIDWSIMNSKWFTTDANADLNHDGIVNAIDYSMLNANWFKTW